jgi:hypothetical protein
MMGSRLDADTHSSISGARPEPLSATEISMISWSRVALVIKFAALAASLHLEPSGLGNKRIALAAEITTFETALDGHAKSRSKKEEDWAPVDASAPVS